MEDLQKQWTKWVIWIESKLLKTWNRRERWCSTGQLNDVELAVSHISQTKTAVRTTLQYAQSECHNTIKKEWQYVESPVFPSKTFRVLHFEKSFQASQVKVKNYGEELWQSLILSVSKDNAFSLGSCLNWLTQVTTPSVFSSA